MYKCNYWDIFMVVNEEICGLDWGFIKVGWLSKLLLRKLLRIRILCSYYWGCFICVDKKYVFYI